MKIGKCARYFQWCIQGLVWASSFLRSKSQKAARLRKPRLQGQCPWGKLPYLQSETRLKTLQRYFIWQFQAWKCLESIKMVMFKTHGRCPFKIGSKNWLKRKRKSVLIAFFKKSIQIYLKVKFFTMLRYTCNKDLKHQDCFSWIWAHNLGAQTGKLALKTLWIWLWFFNMRV